MIDPITVYQKLSHVSPNPFSALYKTGNKWLICCQPGKIFKKAREKIISQPIKGTSKRIQGDKRQDEMNKDELFIATKTVQKM